MMNQTLTTLSSHKSIRKFKSQIPTQEILNLILDSLQSAPSFLNGQQYTVIVVKDSKRKENLAQLCGDQKWIREAPIFFVFCLDFHRTHLSLQARNLTEVITPRVEALLVGSVDVGLALANSGAAVESLGLGYVPIGGIRMHSQEVIDLLKLPSRVFPVVGMALGYPDEDPMLKPRLPRDVVIHNEVYSQSDLPQALQDYDSRMEEYTRIRSGGKAQQSWSSRLATYYTKTYFPGVTNALKSQGFDLE